jgi:hypothetical protein
MYQVPEDAGKRLLQNVGKCLPNMASDLKR